MTEYELSVTEIVRRLYLIYLHDFQSHRRFVPLFACLISWPAWKITSLGLFWPAWLHKAPPNPAACPQLIFLVATLFTAPPTDYGKGMLEGVGGLLGLTGDWIEPWAASTPRFCSYGTLVTLLSVSPPTQCLCFAWHHHFTSSVSCLLIKHPTHSTSVVVTSRFTPPTEHQSASLPISWSSLFCSVPLHICTLSFQSMTCPEDEKAAMLMMRKPEEQMKENIGIVSLAFALGGLVDWLLWLL